MKNMCKAFSFIATRRKVYWKLGMESHEKIKEYFSLDDREKDTLCPCEINPKNGSYLSPDEWVFKFDNECPEWWKKSNEKMSWEAFNEWREQLDKILIRKKIINPFSDIIPPKEISEEIISILKEWASVVDSVWDSVRDSVRVSVSNSVVDSVWASVVDSVWDSVRDSVWDSVRDSVRVSVSNSVVDSVWGYEGSFFKLDKWKNVKHKKGEYPFSSCVKLWEMGLVPSFDGISWRLHGGKKGKVLFEITQKELKRS